MNGTEFLRNLVKNKTVAIVGNAKSIFDKKNGKEIDNHDIIIRFNRGFITKPESQGRRTDILILAVNLNLDEKSAFKSQYYVNRSKKTTCGSITIENKFRADLKEIIGKQPSSGFMAIKLCDQAKIIDLYGFDFGKTKTFYNPEGFITPHDYDKEHQLIERMNVNIH